ncbi:hypothetical protein IEU95_08595 [Hoyosella rhizosphaerae]|uniref:Uncharacterized protein n=1 Tax=Hoyosella rhizosphaerae TaxID=1755582 RepID=A0A916U1M7_9ACTN|nr:hypothetical protein [Hoyosella rhizosphaerae]MBN4926887.1 hypothetical protein [Hoyosella rhizosphaerae]GGC55736.1 hypothetical protein GCM10011410_05170 [Hoyosella rhizosphaerae]
MTVKVRASIHIKGYALALLAMVVTVSLMAMVLEFLGLRETTPSWVYVLVAVPVISFVKAAYTSIKFAQISELERLEKLEMIDP